MKMSRRSAIVAGSIATLAVAGTLVAGPAIAKGGRPDGRSHMSANAVGSVESGRGHHMGDQRRGMGDMMGVARGRMLHSEGVIASKDSAGATTYTTVRSQEGKITASSDTSITVKSDDGYTATWPLTATTKISRNGVAAKGSEFVVGDVVDVRGSVATGGAVTTVDVHTEGPRFKPSTPPAGANG